jgi:hypothetical protein
MKFYNASFSTIFIRFNLAVATVVLSFVIGMPFLALLALPIVLSAVLGISFEMPRFSGATTESIKRPEMASASMA